MDSCPHCYYNLRGPQVPDTDPPEYFSLLVGVEVASVYSGGVLFYECPNCDGRIHRFRAGTDMWRKAVPYVRSLA